ncbi:NAD(P)-dependent oxidoreductase [Nocardia sp. JCM 34519]|nr:NAD-dependent epimerase/dehydratase family protein [Nocardia sp. JCM 34519]
MGLTVITGAGGYLGGLLAHAVAQRDGARTVRCVVRRREDADRFARAGFDVACGDLVDRAFCARAVAGAQVVIHAAARLGSGPRAEFFQVNAEATRWLGQAALIEEARFVYVSSIEAYGDFAGRTLTEDQPHLGTGHAYSESKYAGEQAITRLYGDRGRGDYIIVRPGMIYGPNSPYWTHRYLRLASLGSIGVLADRRRFPDGGRVFPVFESDVLDALATAATGSAVASGVYNLVHDEGLTWWDWAWAHHLLAGTGRPHRVPVRRTRLRSALRPRDGRAVLRRRLEVELRHAVIPHEKARAELGWYPRRFRAGMVLCAAHAEDSLFSRESR